jgi:hypothetical protein
VRESKRRRDLDALVVVHGDGGEVLEVDGTGSMSHDKLDQIPSCGGPVDDNPKSDEHRHERVHHPRALIAERRRVSERLRDREKQEEDRPAMTIPAMPMELVIMSLKWSCA